MVGALLALGVGAFGTLVGLDRERGFYPTVMIVIASYYWLFAILGGGTALMPEVLVATPFIVLAVAGFRRNLWLVVAALVAHGAMDIVHAQLVHNEGVPDWWPSFCLAFDVVAGVYLALGIFASKLSRAP
jgi:hypothetical protein